MSDTNPNKIMWINDDEPYETDIYYGEKRPVEVTKPLIRACACPEGSNVITKEQAEHAWRFANQWDDIAGFLKILGFK